MKTKEEVVSFSRIKRANLEKKKINALSFLDNSIAPSFQITAFHCLFLLIYCTNDFN